MGHDRLSPPYGLGPRCSQTRWSFIRLQYASLWNHIAQRDLDHSGPWLAVSPPPRAMGQGSLRPGETVRTRAVNQQAWTMTPKEAKTLLSVNAHHNSCLLNLKRNGVESEGFDSWMKIFCQTERLHYLICTNSVFYDPGLSPAMWKMLLSENTAIYQKFTYNINVFLNPGDTRFSIQQLW